MSDDSKLCGLCGERPVGPGGIMCPTCFRRTTFIAQTDPYWFMTPGKTQPEPPEDWQPGSELHV